MEQSHPVIKNELADYLLRPQKIVFIVNPRAGTNLQKNISKVLERHLNHRRFTYGVWATEKPGHGFELAQQAVKEGYEIVVAVGGDGSVNEIGKALIGTPVALGIIPAGSGNGLAMHLGYGRQITAAIKKLNTARIQLIDVGMLNGRPFFNVAGIGFDGMVSTLMKKSPKRGFLPYFLKSVEAGLRYQSIDCQIELEGRSFTQTCFAIAVANGPMYGYNFQIAPGASLDDGLFDVVVLKEAPRWRYFAAVPAALQGKIYSEGFVDHYSVASVTVKAEQPLYVHVDGEGMMLNEALHFTLKPKALHLLIPE